MPCLSLRHHKFFARLCRWVSAVRSASPDPVKVGNLENPEDATQNPANTTTEYASNQTISPATFKNGDEATKIVANTLYITHERAPLPAVSLLPDHSLANLVNAKLQALNLAESAPTETIPTEVTSTKVTPTEPVTGDVSTSTISNPSVSSPTEQNPTMLNPVLPNPAPEPTPKPLVSPKTPRLPFANFFSRPARPTRPRRLSASELINAESRLGSTIFGPIPAGHRREFFHDKANVWIWHESWQDLDASERQITVRYEIRPNGIYKKFAAGKYIKLKGAELTNFRKAAHAYLQVVKTNLYSSANVL